MAKKQKSQNQAKPITHVAIILDKSGSMGSTKDSAISGFNETVQDIKERAKTQEIYCSLVTFNGEVYEHLWNVPAEQLAEADPADYQPNGSTAMRDAVGYTVQKLLNTTDHENTSVSYLVYVISDGETNADHHYGAPALKELMGGVQATKRWTITYIGCSESYMEEIARQTFTPIANMASWSNTTEGGVKKGFANVRSRTAKYFDERALGGQASSNFASDQDGAVADYEQEAVFAAPAPQIYSQDELVAATNSSDLHSILDKGPKYCAQVDMSYNGEALFANSQRVQWEGSTAGGPNELGGQSLNASVTCSVSAIAAKNFAQRGKIKK